MLDYAARRRFYYPPYITGRRIKKHQESAGKPCRRRVISKAAFIPSAGILLIITRLFFGLALY
jgi:hypothetical protein